LGQKYETHLPEHPLAVGFEKDLIESAYRLSDLLMPEDKCLLQ
jgi:hypothetical protein